jgi:hypothetical protein
MDGSKNVINESIKSVLRISLNNDHVCFIHLCTWPYFREVFSPVSFEYDIDPTCVT